MDLDTLGLALRVVFSLTVVIGLMWLSARLLRAKGAARGVGVLEVVARTQVGRGAAVTLVRVADRVLVIGVTERAVTLLSETDPATVEQAQTSARSTRVAVPGQEPGSPGQVPGQVPGQQAGALEGSILAPSTWRRFVEALRDRTARR